MTEKSVTYPLSFSPRDLPEGWFVEINFYKVLPDFKNVFYIAFNLVSKFLSYPVASTGIAKFILTISDAEEIAVAVIVEAQLRVARVLLRLLEPLPDYLLEEK